MDAGLCESHLHRNHPLWAVDAKNANFLLRLHAQRLQTSGSGLDLILGFLIGDPYEITNGTVCILWAVAQAWLIGVLGDAVLEHVEQSLEVILGKPIFSRHIAV